MLLLLFTFSVRPADLRLRVGETRVLDYPGIRSVLVANDEVVRVDTFSASVRLTGLAVGASDLDLTDARGKTKRWSVSIESAGPAHASSLKTMLEGIEGIDIRSSGDSAVITGEIYRTDDYQRIAAAMRAIPGIKNRARFNPKVLAYVAQQINLELQSQGFASVRAEVDGNTIGIRGDVESRDERSDVVALVKSLSPVARFDLTQRLGADTGVYIDVKFLEVRRSSAADLGIRWPGGFSADGQASLSQGALSTTFNLGAQNPLMLHTLVQKGIVRVLSNPKILCKNGVPASFLAGGEIPIRLVSERTANVMFKPYGIQLDITAKVDRSKNVALDLFARISDIDASTTIEGLPGFIEHHVKTSADLKLNDTIALGGLLENRARKNISKFPLLGHIPVIGELFKSRSFQNNESEFLVTLTPLDPHAERAHRRMPVMNVQAKKQLEFSLLD